MTTRSERYRYEQDESKSRVLKNQELYNQIYANDSYFQGDENPQIERTNEIDIEKVKELLKGREIYRREMKMRELNMIKPEKEEVPADKDETLEKSYDINAYLDKASSDRIAEPYHKIAPEVLKQAALEKEEDEEPTLEELHEMGTTALSLDMFGDLNATNDLDTVSGDEEIEGYSIDEANDELVATVTKTEAFFTDSIKLNLTDEDEDEANEKMSPVVKIIIALLVLVIIALIIFLLI